MTASKTKRSPARRAVKAKSPAQFELRVALKGDKQLAENVIVEVLAAARRLGLEAPNVQVSRKPRVGPKRIAKRKSR
jgi:biopolymer transport protein ExbD